MSNAASVPEAGSEAPHGAVVVGIVTDQPARVVREAARYAQLFGVPLVAASVDVTRFVAAEDPDGFVHTAPVDVAIPSAAESLPDLEAAVRAAVEGIDVRWSVRQLVGDPAAALMQLADRTDARLLVVGTRRRGIGESIREFFTGSVAVRLAHRQHRPVLVVPVEEPAGDDEELWPI